jgi:hypothetical protein
MSNQSSEIQKVMKQKTAFLSLLWVMGHRNQSFYAKIQRSADDFQANANILLKRFSDKVISFSISISIRAEQKFLFLKVLYYDTILSLIHICSLLSR